ncbi:MAG: D-glycero-beta-D-manno-heptose 1-phosphate adenylyltransferase [Alphaproteobacteria bacterium]|nr:D-glycero-beta-D-manno-heptose 1-phosphate adenylyltransferase [Alphaproteobacteria bacterium]
MPRPDQIAQLSAGRVLVVGDVILDHYVSGGVSRVSDEAPVPIIQVTAERWTAGGAANVAANISDLGGRAVLVGVVGIDAAADTLGAMGGAVERRLLPEASRATTVKTRYMGGQHQMLRVDREHLRAIRPETEDALIAAVREVAGACGAVVVSDYAKGVLTDRVLSAVIAAGKAAGCVVLVDPKREDWSVYAGADYITPNRKELRLATGLPSDLDEDCERAARRAMLTTGASILLTRSEKGMSLYRDGAPVVHLPAKAREVFDVSGAGDTLAASLALGLAVGLPMEDVMAISNVAAGIVVGKRGTATTNQAEIRAELGERKRDASVAGALSLEAMMALRRGWADQDLSVGFTNGCFDILHPGHVWLLQQAATVCDRLIVALNTDASVKRLKGPTRPLQAQDARAEVMSRLKGVDAVVLFDEDTPLEIIQALQPDVLVKGADYTEDRIVGADIVRARGGRVIRAELVEGQSTTRIVEAGRAAE